MIDNVKHIYFLGIGGIGMSALARYFLTQGVKVSGYDKTCSELTLQLEKEGITIHYQDNGENALTNIDLVVYTPAIPKNLNEFQAFKNSGIPMLKRAKILGEISKQYFTIAIAGTHGKTTITSMISHFLNASKIPINAFIGGIATNLNSNLLLSKDAKIMVVEADEFDRSFLHLHPDIAIISSMDADHLDIYENKNSLIDSFFEFTNNIKTEGTLIINENLLVSPEFKGNVIKYGFDSNKADILAQSLEINEANRTFSVIDKKNKTAGNYILTMAGKHNMLNATAAITVANILNANPELLSKAVKSYLGVKRRFEFRINTPNQILIDDYAHHPTEINAAIATAKELFPNKKILGVFQPHLFSRTRDFMQDFASELSKLDALILLDIYPARELPIEGITSSTLLNEVKIEKKYIVSKEHLNNFVLENKFPVILMMGAGDIDKLVLPLEQKLLQNG